MVTSVLKTRSGGSPRAAATSTPLTAPGGKVIVRGVGQLFLLQQAHYIGFFGFILCHNYFSPKMPAAAGLKSSVIVFLPRFLIFSCQHL